MCALLCSGRGVMSRGKGAFGRVYRKHERKLDRLPSLAVSGDWEMIEEFDLVHLLKLVANIPAVEDLAWHGYAVYYTVYRVAAVVVVVVVVVKW